MDSYKRLYIIVKLKRAVFAEYVNDNKHCPDDRATRVLELIGRAMILMERLLFQPDSMDYAEKDAAKYNIVRLCHDATSIVGERSSVPDSNRIPMNTEKVTDQQFIAEYNRTFLQRK